jgi:hypothetical protein
LEASASLNPPFLSSMKNLSAWNSLSTFESIYFPSIVVEESTTCSNLFFALNASYLDDVFETTIAPKLPTYNY